MGDEPKEEATNLMDLTALTERLAKETDGSAEREAYLEKLKRQIEAGEYHVDSERLARHLLSEFDQSPDADAK